MPTERNPRVVTSALKRAGLKAGGIRYTQFGYVDNRTGEKVTEPVYLVSRTTKARYGGSEDLGYVAIHAIENPATGYSSDEGEVRMLDAAQAAVEAAGLPFHRRSPRSLRVLDEEPEPVKSSVAVTINLAYAGRCQHKMVDDYGATLKCSDRGSQTLTITYRPGGSVDTRHYCDRHISHHRENIQGALQS